jgi:hypothetical protein
MKCYPSLEKGTAVVTNFVVFLTEPPLRPA